MIGLKGGFGCMRGTELPKPENKGRTKRTKTNKMLSNNKIKLKKRLKMIL